MPTLPNLNNSLPGALPGTSGPSSGGTSSTSSTPPGIASAGNDSFTASDKKTDKKDKDETSAKGIVAAVKAMLLRLLQMFIASASNANPLFRISLHETALKMLGGALAQIQNVLSDKNLEGTNVLSEATNLNATLKFLTGNSQSSMEEQKETQKSYMTLNKEMATLAKPAS